jgi:multidrug resistance efflux pump
MNPSQFQGQQGRQVPLAVAAHSLSADGASIVITYAAPTQTFTQVQLYQALAQAQANLDQLNSNVASSNATIASLQAQLALFSAPVKEATPPVLG